MRQNIDGGGWFNRKTAKSFEEATRWNGNNHISIATGTQWDHQKLYLSNKGAWVMHTWSQWQGSGESWELIDEATAHAWLLKNGHADEVPDEVLAASEV